LENVTFSEEPIIIPPAGEPPAFTAHWGGWRVFGIFVLCAVVFVIGQFVVALLVIKSNPSLTKMLFHVRLGSPAEQLAFYKALLTAPVIFWTEFVSDVALVGCLLLVGKFALDITPRALGLRAPQLGAVGIGVLGGLACLVLGEAMGLIQSRLFGEHPQVTAVILASHRGAMSFALDLLAVSVIAPIAEEIFFRGFLFTAFLQRLPLSLSAVLSGVIFGLGHGDLWNALPLAAIGVVLAYVYRRTGNLWSNVIAHSMNNGITLALAFAFPELVKH
jgi:membrane protease YdiL (CAAX protease family)